jgi:hypothetical protein
MMFRPFFEVVKISHEILSKFHSKLIRGVYTTLI